MAKKPKDGGTADAGSGGLEDEVGDALAPSTAVSPHAEVAATTLIALVSSRGRLCFLPAAQAALVLVPPAWSWPGSFLLAMGLSLLAPLWTASSLGYLEPAPAREVFRRYAFALLLALLLGAPFLLMVGGVAAAPLALAAICADLVALVLGGWAPGVRPLVQAMVALTVVVRCRRFYADLLAFVVEMPRAFLGPQGLVAPARPARRARQLGDLEAALHLLPLLLPHALLLGAASLTDLWRLVPFLGLLSFFASLDLALAHWTTLSLLQIVGAPPALPGAPAEAGGPASVDPAREEHP